MAALDSLEHVQVESRAEWRSWLAANHATSPGIWVVVWKAGRRRAVPYDEVVEEALCFGWIDSKPGVVDADRSKRLLTPRNPTSSWSKVNKERVDRLEAAGLLAPAGVAAIEAAKANGAWGRLDDVEALVVPNDLAAAFDALAGSREQWEAFPRSVRRQHLEWITVAKRPETRSKRIGEVVEGAARGERANQWRPKA